MNTYRAVGGALVCSFWLWAIRGVAQTWTQTSAPSLDWCSVACSADGGRVAAAGGASIYTSQDHGLNWSLTGTLDPDWYWTSLATSADGGTWLASSQDSWDSGAVFVSTNAGLTWVINYTNTCCTSVACSGNGRGMAVGVRPPIHGYGGVVISQDSGGSWNYSLGSTHMCVAIAGSADGRTLAATGNDFVFAIPLGVSTDAGVSWRTGPASLWSGVACSGDGNTLFAATGASIYVSRDRGSTWDFTSSPGAAIACSADGTHVGTTAGTALYTSTNSGATWVSNALPALSWSCVALSADGLRLYAAAKGGGIYTCQATPGPLLKISQSALSPWLSWVVPSMKFGLQESPNLTNWVEVGVTPVLNCTNLHYEVGMPVPSGPRFYRLATP